MNTNSLPFLSIEYAAPADNQSELEIVERKGIGHPDSLADGIAEAISIDYSRFCLERFGAVLHHNVDKAFIGRGHFLCDYGSSEMLHPIEVVTNGRMSNTMDGVNIDIAPIQEQAAINYVRSILPHLDVATQIVVHANASQRTQRDYWFSPRNKDDIPDALDRSANDTSVCIGHYPFTLCEKLALGVEKSLWHMNDDRQLKPNLPYIGQDVKVMVFRRGTDIDITVCVPIISGFCESRVAYEQLVRECEDYLRGIADEIVNTHSRKGDRQRVSLHLNSGVNGYRRYMLCIGSCIECGEEGVVGRGNTIRGFISCSRPHSVEAPFGKNPVYHTGRVYGYLSQYLAKSLYDNLGVGCSVFLLTKASHTLIPPSHLHIRTSSPVNRAAVENIVEQCLSIDYVNQLLALPQTLHTW